jgi:hypothetical protein
MVVGVYEKVKKHFGIVEENRITSRMMQVVDVSEQILRALDIDTRAVNPGAPYKAKDEAIAVNQYKDEWGVVRVKPPSGLYYDQVSFPLSGQIAISDIVNYPWPDPHDEGRSSGLKERVREIREGTGCAAVLNRPSASVHVSQYLRGFEDWYVDVAADQKLAGALFDAVLEVNMAVCEELLEEVGTEVDVLLASDDLEQFIKWVEAKLEQHGVGQKLVPADEAIEKHAEKTRDDKLSEAVREHVDTLSNIDDISEALVEKFKKRIRTNDMPKRTAKWGEKLEPSPWRTYVDKALQKRVDKVDESLETATKEALVEALETIEEEGDS